MNDVTVLAALLARRPELAGIGIGVHFDEALRWSA